MIKLQLLPASFGDCLLLSYGSDGALHYVLVDAGLKGTYTQTLKPALEKLGSRAAFDLVVVTHLDRDHICGMLPLVEAMPDLIGPADIWFNGHDHLSGDVMGTAEAESLGKLLQRKGLPWNEAFDRRAVVVPEKGHGDLPQRTLPGGATITLLSPYQAQLDALAVAWDGDNLGSWEKTTLAGGPETTADDILGKRRPLGSVDVSKVLKLAGQPFSQDTTPPNGSSIAFLFEFGGQRILFGADAFPGVLLKSLQRLASSGDRYRVDAFKLAHHGSMDNLSPDLLSALDCPCYLVSTNGSSYGHPHPEAIARVLTRGSPRELCFNYRSEYTKVWDNEAVKQRFHVAMKYPKKGTPGYALELASA